MVQVIQNPLRERNKSEADERLGRVKGNKISPSSSVPGGNSQGFTEKVGWEDCSRGKRAEEVGRTEAGSLLGQDRRQGMACRWEFRTPWAVSRFHPL